MIRLKKCRVFAILCFTAMALGACGKRTEAVISDGEDITEEDANALGEELQEKYPDCEVEVYEGGQPIYYYVVSVE